MPQFSQASLNKLGSCHPDLIILFTYVVIDDDCTIICGYRGKGAQELAFMTNKSQVHWPNSRHNKKPSLAVDVAPYFSVSADRS